jgi:D-alanyl-D-alanine carboxypeptidase
MKYTISTILILLVLNLFSQEETKREQITELMEEVILCEGKKPVCNFLMTVKNLDTGFEMNQGVGIVGRNDTPVDSSYQFKIAGITKTFVAAVVLQLEEEGKLSLKDPIKSYLEPLDFIRYDELLLHKGENYADSVSIEMLLNHTSGIADVFIDKETRFFLKVLLNKDKAYSPQGFFNLYYKYKLNKHPNNLPGEDFHYSDINYMLLGFIIEEVDKKSLHRSIRDRILLPLDMKSTYFQYVEEVQGSGKKY